MIYILEAIIYLFNGALLAWYCSAFLMLKGGKNRQLPLLIMFGAVYVLLRYAVEYFPFEYIPNPALTIMKTVAMAVFMFCLSFAFFIKETNKQAFIIISFFAVLDVCSFVVVSVFSFISDSVVSFFNNIIISNLSSAEQITIYINVYTIFNYILFYTIQALLCLFAVRSIAKGFTHKEKTLTTTDTLAMTLPCFTMLAVSFAMRSVFFGMDGGEQILLGTSGIFFTASAIFLLLTLVASVRFAQKSIQYHMEEKDTAIIREQIKQLKSRDGDSMYMEMRGFRHDMKNHLANIGLLIKSVSSGNADAGIELEKYLAKLDETLSELDSSYDTGNAVTNVVLQHRYAEAKQKCIDFISDFTFPKEIGIDAYDVAVVLCNALDNAFEACAGVPEHKRFVKLGSRRKGSTFWIEISNNYDGDVLIDELTSLPVSSKQDSDEHGFGLPNVRRISQKYLGGIDIQLSTEDSSKIFYITIMLQGILENNTEVSK